MKERGVSGDKGKRMQTTRSVTLRSVENDPQPKQKAAMKYITMRPNILLLPNLISNWLLLGEQLIVGSRN